jgi:hypothetical protein
MANISKTRTVLLLIAVAAVIGGCGCNTKRRDLLRNVDYQALVKACRDVLKVSASGGLKPGRYDVRWSPRSAEASAFPKAILDLAPSYVVVGGDGSLTIEMHGGFDHFGVKAYAADFKEPYPNFIYGSRKLIDGLWYYDDEYEDNRPSYRKKIDAWIEEGRKRKQ